MRKLSRLIVLFILVLVPIVSFGQVTLFPNSLEHPPFAHISEELTDHYIGRARESIQNADLEDLESIISILIDLNIYQDPIAYGRIENYKGILEYYKNNVSVSLEHYLRAFDYFDMCGSSDNISNIMNNIAVIFAQIEDYESTRKYLIRAVDFTSNEDMYARSIYMINLAETESLLKNCYTGIRIASDLLEIYDPEFIDFSEIAIYGVIIGCYNNLSDDKMSAEWIEKGLSKMNANIGYIDLLPFYTEAIEYYFKQNDYKKVVELGQNIYPPPDSTFKLDIYESIDHMAIAARMIGSYDLAIELNEFADRIEFGRTNISREDLITPLMVEYSFNRDITERDQVRRELMENSIKEKAQTRLVRSLIVVAAILLAFVFILNHTRKLRKNYKTAILLKNKKLEGVNLEIQGHNKEMEKENRLLDTLISVFAHDLINPFQAILGFSQLMISDHESLETENFYEYSDLLSDTSFQLNQLLINLKSMSFVQDKSQSFEVTSVNIKLAISNMLKLFESSARKKDVILKFDSGTAQNVLINKEIFESVLRNVISNAVKFSNPEGVVEISYEKIDNSVEIYIKDYGMGISEELRQSLLSREIIESRPGTSNEKGSGIGLSICIELLDMFDSTIDIESKEGLGTTVTIEIPLADE